MNKCLTEALCKNIPSTAFSPSEKLGLLYRHMTRFLPEPFSPKLEALRHNVSSVKYLRQTLCIYISKGVGTPRQVGFLVRCIWDDTVQLWCSRRKRRVLLCCEPASDSLCFQSVLKWIPEPISFILWINEAEEEGEEEATRSCKQWLLL